MLLGTALVAQDPSWRRQMPNFWSLEQRDAGFRSMEKVYPARAVSVGVTFTSSEKENSRFEA